MTKILKLKISIFAVISLILCGSLFFSNFIEAAFGLNKQPNNNNSGFRVVYADVGQGDMTLIETGKGDIILIDSSTNKESAKVNSFLEQELVNKNKTKIDYVIATHPDEDHVGNMPLIFNLFAVEVCYVPNVSYYQADSLIDAKFYGFAKTVNTATYRNFLRAVSAEAGCDARQYTKNEVLNLEDENTLFKFLSEPISENAPEGDINDYSPIMMLSHAGKKFVFSGDAGSKIEKRFLDNADSEVLNDIKNIDIYKAGHHGSSGSSRKEFLLALNPKVVLVSAGKGNSYGHPSAAFLQRVSENIPSARVLITYEAGNIVCFILDGVLKINDFEVLPTQTIRWWHIVLGSVIVLAILLFSKDVYYISAKQSKNNRKKVKRTAAKKGARKKR